MDLAQMFLSEAVAIFGYALLVTAVYKIFQLGKEVAEIKELLKKSTRNSSQGTAALPAVAEDDTATAYSENLLRSLQAEVPRSQSEQQTTP